MPEDKPPELTRRSCLKSLFTLGVVGGGGFAGAKYFLTRTDMDYSSSFLAEELPTLRELILKEGEQYLSSPEVVEEDKIDSLEGYVDELFPEVEHAMCEYLSLEQKTQPSLKKYSKAVYIAMAMCRPIGLALILQSFRLSAKNKRTRRSFNWLTAATIFFGIAHVINESSVGGGYNTRSETINYFLKDYRSVAWNTAAHEYAHHLYNKYLDDPRGQPKWLREGFAFGLSWSLMNNLDEFTSKKYEYRKSNLNKLVTTYYFVCNREGIEPDLPEEFDEFNCVHWGDSLLGGNAMGYTFFRLRERQKGPDIYRRILLDGNFDVLKPLPPDGFADRWLK